VNAPVNAPAESPAGASLGTLPELADRFRFQVTRELARLEASERDPLRGDYLFVIDGVPRFVVVLRGGMVRSGAFVLAGDPQHPQAFLECADAQEQGTGGKGESVQLADVDVSARARVFTDATTLSRLLSGTMKAKAAFLAGKVRIEGDLPGFLRLIGHLKARGVRAPGEKTLPSP
jgi:hypothetical protein